MLVALLGLALAVVALFLIFGLPVLSLLRLNRVVARSNGCGARVDELSRTVDVLERSHVPAASGDVRAGRRRSDDLRSGCGGWKRAERSSPLFRPTRSPGFGSAERPWEAVPSALAPEHQPAFFTAAVNRRRWARRCRVGRRRLHTATSCIRRAGAASNPGTRRRRSKRESDRGGCSTSASARSCSASRTSSSTRSTTSGSGPAPASRSASRSVPASFPGGTVWRVAWRRSSARPWPAADSPSSMSRSTPPIRCTG